jgi:hypothetical protein
MLPNNKNYAWFFQRLNKQSQSFETSHATAKITKHTIKTISSMTCKSLSRSLNKLLFVPLFCMNFFSFPTPFEPFLKQLFWWKPTWTRGQNTPWYKDKTRSEQKSRRKTKLNAVWEKENTRWTIRVKTRVFSANEKQNKSLSETTWCDQTIYCSKQNKRKLKAKTTDAPRKTHSAWRNKNIVSWKVT